MAGLFERFRKKSSVNKIGNFNSPPSSSIDKLTQNIEFMFKVSDHKALRNEYERNRDPVTKSMLLDSHIDMFNALDLKMEKFDKEARVMNEMIDRTRKHLKKNNRDKKLEKKLDKHLISMVDAFADRKENMVSIIENLNYLRENSNIDPYDLGAENGDSEDDNDNNDNNDDSDHNNIEFPPVPLSNPGSDSTPSSCDVSSYHQ